MSTSFNNPDREEQEQGATSPVTDGPVQDSASVAESVEEQADRDEEQQAHSEESEAPPAEENE